MLGVFALSAALKEEEQEKLDLSIKLLEEHSVSLQLGSNLNSKEEIFAGAQYFTVGNLQSRLTALYELKDQENLLALKGGYGVLQCLQALDSNFFNNKRVFGYSDLTALFLKIHQNASLFHSPMLCELSSLSDEELKSFFSFLNAKPEDFKKLLLKYTPDLETQLKASSFIESPAFIYGGNLTLLLSYPINLEIKEGYKKILFIEECNEEAYRLERMLYNALNNHVFDDIDELWLGESLNADFNKDLVLEISQSKGFKVFFDLPFGHKKKFTVPIFAYYE